MPVIRWSNVQLLEGDHVRSACPGIPIFVGSGVTASNEATHLEFADGIIVGTSVKRDGKVFNPVDSRRVTALREAIQRA